MAQTKHGRDIPDSLWGMRLVPYAGPFATPPADRIARSNRKPAMLRPGESKRLPSLAEAVAATGLADGMTISFHHSFREGDMVIGQVLAVIRELGIKNLTFAPSAVVNIKEPSLVGYVKDGTITRIEASGIRGELGDAALSGEVTAPVILRPHGARPRAIEAGELAIDVAFIGASAADEYGNATGLVGPNACGSLGYSFIDAATARKTVIVTDHLVPYPCVPASISQEYADYVVKVDRIGDAALIGKGAARLTRNPRDLMIAELAAKVIVHSGFFKDGYSFQTGAGAIAIACTGYLADATEAAGYTASFALGGLTASIVEMFDRGLIGSVQASQCFDSVAARAVHERPNIVEIDNSVYSNIHNKGCMVNMLDIGVLGALEVDMDFNVNILTGSGGEMMGGLGGGPDVAGGAEVSIVALPIVRGRTASVVKKVFTLCTPGETIAVVVTEAGIALNPGHRNYNILRENLSGTNLKLMAIEELYDIAVGITGEADPVPVSDEVACIVQYRDGTVIDTIKRLRK